MKLIRAALLPPFCPYQLDFSLDSNTYYQQIVTIEPMRQFLDAFYHYMSKIHNAIKNSLDKI